MISWFLSSRLSGYLSIALVVAVLSLVWYIYNEGKRAGCAKQQVELVGKANDAIEDIRNADDARRSVNLDKLREDDGYRRD